MTLEMPHPPEGMVPISERGRNGKSEKRNPVYRITVKGCRDPRLDPESKNWVFGCGMLFGDQFGKEYAEERLLFEMFAEAHGQHHTERHRRVEEGPWQLMMLADPNQAMRRIVCIQGCVPPLKPKLLKPGDPGFGIIQGGKDVPG